MTSNWQHKAKCAQPEQSPEAWEVHNLPTENRNEAARQLCAGCPVLQQCAADAIKPINMTSLLGTFEAPDLIYVSGVVRAGVPT